MFDLRDAEATEEQTITEVTFRKENGGTLTFHLSDGAVFTTSNARFQEALNHSSRQVIPAAAGTYLLHTACEEGELSVCKSAVIGWVVHSSGHPYPLLSAGAIGREDYSPTILHPDGSVDDIWAHYDSYHQWFEATELEWKAAIANGHCPNGTRGGISNSTPTSCEPR